MGLFTRRKIGKIPIWSPKPEKFMEDDVDGYLNAHQRSILQDVCGFLPPSTRDKTLIAGGFAAYVAGITKSADDVDLFCVDKMIFERLSNTIPGETIQARRGYGTVIKFERNGVRYDLVDATPRLEVGHRCATGLLCNFDINWCMAAINVSTGKIICCPDALSSTPMVNDNRADEHIECAVQRLEKYSKRLVREADPEYLKYLIKDIRAK